MDGWMDGTMDRTIEYDGLAFQNKLNINCLTNKHINKNKSINK